MKNYRKEILEYFIKSYENSAYGNGLSPSPRRITFDLNKKYPDYGGSRFYELTEEIEKVAFQLCEEGLVQFSNKSIYGKRKLEFVNNEKNIEKIYHELQRKSLKEKKEKYLLYLEKYDDDSFLAEFQKVIKKKVQNNKGLSPYLKTDDVEDLENVMKILQGMKNQEEEISFRKFSEKVLGDTKKLEKYKNKIYHIIKDFYDDSIKNVDDAFELFYIRKNPAYVYLKGNAILQINDQVIDLNQMNQYFVLPSICIKRLKIKEMHAKQIMTIENLTSFHDVSLKDTFFIFTNGFHNHAIEEFLKCIYDFLGENVSYLHFGDIDAGGFHIYENLKKKTQIPFKTYNMNIEMLKKYNVYTKSLTENDRKRLLTFKENHHEVIEYMLKHNVKLEQEIIGDENNES